jgi:hypothetical protein
MKRETFKVRMGLPMYGGKRDFEELIEWVDTFNM